MAWPKGKPRKKKEGDAVPDASTTPTDAPDTNEQKPGAFTIEMENAPEDTFQQEEKPGVLKNIFSQLGLQSSSDSSEPKKQPALKLNARQRQFCETFTPMAAGVLVLSFTFGYSKINEAYRALAPSEEVATNIVAPLIRIYARQAKFVNSVNPNYIDAAASFTALIGYIVSTYRMYQQIKSGAWDEEAVEEYEDYYNDEPVTRESRNSGANNGRENLSKPATQNIHAVPGGTRNNTDHDSKHDLTDAQRYQFEKLSLLRKRDFDSRARRSGRYGAIQHNVG